MERVVDRLAGLWRMHPKTAERELEALPVRIADALAAMQDQPEKCELYIDKLMSAVMGVRYDVPTIDLKRAEIKADAYEDITQGLCDLDPDSDDLAEQHIRSLAKQSATSAALCRQKQRELDERRRQRALQPAH